MAHVTGREDDSFGMKLRQARLQKGISVSALARKLDTSRSTVHAWERNRSFPNFQSLEKLQKLGIL